MMINFDGYKINTNEMFFLCLRDTAQRIKNKDYTKLLENTFLEQVPSRIPIIDKWLSNNNLPTALDTPQAWRIIHYFLLENAENNGLSTDNSFLITNSMISKKSVLRVQVPERTLTPLWTSILIDLFIKMGQTQIERFPNWYWGIQDVMPRQATTFAYMCLYDMESDSDKFQQDFSSFFSELCSYYIKDIARNKDTDMLTSSFLNMESKAEKTNRYYLPLSAKQNVDNLTNFHSQITAEYEKDRIKSARKTQRNKMFNLPANSHLFTLHDAVELENSQYKIDIEDLEKIKNIPSFYGDYLETLYHQIESNLPMEVSSSFFLSQSSIFNPTLYRFQHIELVTVSTKTLSNEMQLRKMYPYLSDKNLSFLEKRRARKIALSIENIEKDYWLRPLLETLKLDESNDDKKTSTLFSQFKNLLDGKNLLSMKEHKKLFELFLDIKAIDKKYYSEEELAILFTILDNDIPITFYNLLLDFIVYQTNYLSWENLWKTPCANNYNLKLVKSFALDHDSGGEAIYSFIDDLPKLPIYDDNGEIAHYFNNIPSKKMTMEALDFVVFLCWHNTTEILNNKKVCAHIKSIFAANSDHISVLKTDKGYRRTIKSF